MTGAASRTEAKREAALDRHTFTPSMQRVARYLMQGMSDREIADHMDIATGTVKNRVAAIKAALSANNRTHCALILWGVLPKEKANEG